MKKYFIIIFLLIIILSNITSEEKKDKNIITKIIEFFIKPKSTTIDLNKLKANLGVQENYCLAKSAINFNKKQADNKLTSSDYLEKAIIESKKGDSQKSNECLEKAISQREKENFEFDENLAMILADQFAENYDIINAKAILIKVNEKELSDLEKKQELKRIADIFFKRISNTYEAKQMIEELIKKEEYEIAHEVLIKSYTSKFIDKNYFDEKTKLVMELISLKEKKLKPVKVEDNKQLEKIKITENKNIMKAKEETQNFIENFDATDVGQLPKGWDLEYPDDIDVYAGVVDSKTIMPHSMPNCLKAFDNSLENRSQLFKDVGYHEYGQIKFYFYMPENSLNKYLHISIKNYSTRIFCAAFGNNGQIRYALSEKDNLSVTSKTYSYDQWNSVIIKYDFATNYFSLNYNNKVVGIFKINPSFHPNRINFIIGNANPSIYESCTAYLDDIEFTINKETILPLK